MTGYLLLDTSTPTCRIVCVHDDTWDEYAWEAGRSLAKNLLGYIEEALASSEMSLDELEGIGVFRGPGSFTGLRIGMTVVNTIAWAREIPIITEVDEDWAKRAYVRLQQGENEQLAKPLYGAPARITTPKK